MAVKTRGDTTVASGFEERTILKSLVSAIVGGVMAQLTAPRPLAERLSMSMMLIAISLGTRYVVRVSPEGVELKRYIAWFICFHRQRYMLDAQVFHYRTLTKDEPGGICIVDPYALDLWESESPHFAQHWDPKKTMQVRDSLVKAIEKARQKVEQPSPKLRHPIFGFPPWSDALPLEMAKWDARGRLRQIESTKAILFGTVTIPAGSRFYFNGDRYTDPRRDDRLVRIVLRAPARVARHVVRAGASLMFDAKTRLTAMRGAFDGEMKIGRKWVDGRQVLGFNEKGVLTSFTLTRPGNVGKKYKIPAASRFTWWSRDRLLPARWSCWLGGPLVLPEVTLGRGDRIEISGNGNHITGILPSKDVMLAGLVLKGGIAVMPLKRNGRLDLKKCQKMGLVEEEPSISSASASQ